MACGAFVFSQASAAATAGNLAQATASRSLQPWPWRQSAGRMAGVSRFSSGGAEDGGGRDVGIGVQDQVAFCRQVDIGEGFADAFGEGVVAMYEDRDVGAQRQAEHFQFAATEPGPPQVVEGKQHGGGIG